MSMVSAETQQKVGEEVRDCKDLPPSQQMAMSHLPSASSRAAVSDAPATARTYSLRPENGVQSCVPNVSPGAAEKDGSGNYILETEFLARRWIQTWGVRQ